MFILLPNNKRMQTQQSPSLKQVSKNRPEINEPETDTAAPAQKNKETQQKIPTQKNRPSSTNKNNDLKLQRTKKQQPKLKQSNIQDFKSTNKTQIKNITNKKIAQSNPSTKITKKQQKKIIQESQTSQSQDSSLQKQKSKINSKIQASRKSNKSSSTNSQDSDSDSSKLNKSQQNKKQNTKIVARSTKNTDKNSKKIQMNQSSVIKKNKPKQKKPKDSDDQSDYAPSQREASKNKKQKKPIIQKQYSSEEQKIGLSKLKILPKKGILKNETHNQRENKLKSKPKPEVLYQKAAKSVEPNIEGLKNVQHSQQRSLRKKKPVSYKHMDGDLSDQDMGQKVPYRGRFKSSDMIPDLLQSQIKPQQKSKLSKVNQVPEKMDIQEEKDTVKKSDQNSNEKQQPLKSVATLKEQKISNSIENSNPKKQINTQNTLTNFPDKTSTIRFKQQFQISNQKNNLSLQSRVIVQSVMFRVIPINLGALLAQTPSQQIQGKIKLIYQSLQHAPCCPLWKEGYIRMKKIIEHDQLQSEQQQLPSQEKKYIPSINNNIKSKSIIPQGQHQNHQQIADFSAKKKGRGLKKLQETKMQEPTATTRAANNKKNHIIQNSNIHKEYQNKEVKLQKIVSKQQDQQQILVKKPSKRLRQKKAK